MGINLNCLITLGGLKVVQIECLWFNLCVIRIEEDHPNKTNVPCIINYDYNIRKSSIK